MVVRCIIADVGVLAERGEKVQELQAGNEFWNDTSEKALDAPTLT